MNSFIIQYGAGLVLSLVQILAAIPWVALFALDQVGLSWLRDSRGRWDRTLFAYLIGGFFGLGLFLPGLFFLVQDKESLELLGRLYCAILQLQLAADALVAIFGFLLVVWPKGAAVALAAFREGLRQPMFYLLTGIGIFAMVIAPFIPYFTFGEDFVMMQELGYDWIMLFPLLMGVIAASLSISDEIEGRTAITLMSKPVSRRQFLLGKFTGILLTALVMTIYLSWCFAWAMIYKRRDPQETHPLPALGPPPAWLLSIIGSGEISDFLQGIRLWFQEIWLITPGIILGFSKVMVLIALAVSLATRLPLIVNLLSCLAIYFLGHLTPILQGIADRRPQNEPVGKLLSFSAKVFDTLMPRLDLFGVGPALALEQSMTDKQFLVYVIQVTGFGILFTSVALFVGLLLFEDRDLA